MANKVSITKDLNEVIANISGNTTKVKASFKDFWGNELLQPLKDAGRKLKVKTNLPADTFHKV